ncbi:hypothetical protein [Rhodoferax sp.]|uniref:hypothetical protein n=1 Tax=Rhodoferax sp. TaxID=50421 RepID=UPI002771C9CD|nr:hypothetical protein [Rhodoferax sp.]
MLTPSSLTPSHNLADQAAQSADNAIRSTQRVTNDALDGLAGTVQGIRHQAAPMLDHASERASALAQRGLDGVRDASHHLQERFQSASNGTVNYIKEEPVKSILIAAATGAALMAMISLVSHSRGRN